MTVVAPRAFPVQANARCLPLADASVDLLITSPPYFALRSYRDAGAHYDGQVGSEPTPQAFLEALWEVTKECWRVLKPTGSLFVNLGDKRNSAASGQNTGTGNAGKMGGRGVVYKGCRPKSKMLLPHRFAIGCEDGLADPDGIGWIVRQDIVWSKPNGLPESVTDRVRDSHEMWFHFTKEGRYFSATDEIREQCATADRPGERRSYPAGSASGSIGADGEHVVHRWAGLPLNPLGKLPGSVWTVASEPLTLPDAVKAHYDLPDHFAAFPQEIPRRLILGWSPSGVCVACGEGRRPVWEKTGPSTYELMGKNRGEAFGLHDSQPGNVGQSRDANGQVPTFVAAPRRQAGYACACPDTSAPTTRAVVVDVFGGTGTVAGVARQLGRLGLSFDLSHDYSRLAQWFLRDGRRFGKTSSRTDRENQQVMAL